MVDNEPTILFFFVGQGTLLTVEKTPVNVSIGLIEPQSKYIYIYIAVPMGCLIEKNIMQSPWDA